MIGAPAREERIRGKKRRCARASLAVILVVVAAAVAAAGEGLIASAEPDWPQWRGPRRDGISHEKGLLQQWPTDGPTLLWKAEGLGIGWSSPILVGDRLWITGDVDENLVIFAFDRTGKPIWDVTNGKAWKGPYPGARASCTYSAGRLYNLNAHGRLACLDATSGDEVWTVDVLERFGAKNITWALSECALVDGARVIVSAGGTQALMAALDKRSGETIWTTPPIEEDKPTHASPILFEHGGRRQVAGCSSGHGYGVDADTGELLWTVPLRNKYGTNISAPVYDSGQIFFMTPYTEHGRAYRLEATDQGMEARHIWTSPLDAVTGCAVLVDGTLFGARYREDKWWMGVDWKTGRTTCEFKELTTGCAIYADGRLYCLDEKGAVALLRPEGGALHVKGRFQLPAGKVRDAWAHPVLLDGRLYLRYHDTLWCYDVKAR